MLVPSCIVGAIVPPTAVEVSADSAPTFPDLGPTVAVAGLAVSSSVISSAIPTVVIDHRKGVKVHQSKAVVSVAPIASTGTSTNIIDALGIPTNLWIPAFGISGTSSADIAGTVAINKI